MQIPRFAEATLRSGVVAAIALSVFGAAIPTVARATEEDPWYVAVQTEVNADGIGTTRGPLSLGAEFGPNDDRRVEMAPARVRAGTDYTVRLRAFNPSENVQLRIYRFVPSCPNRECWEWLFTNPVVVDRFGNGQIVFGSDSDRPTRYRYCTTSAQSCRTGWAEFEVTPGGPPTSAELHHGPDTCIDGYVWREAFANDHVCVTPETRTQAANDNSQAAARRQPGGGASGPNTCRQGYVWREASTADLVCVTPETRSQTKYDNTQAINRRVRH